MEIDHVSSVKLNPAILKNIRNRYENSLQRVMLATLYEFYRKLFIKATEDAQIEPETMNPLNIFIQRVDKISIWPEEVIKNTSKALREHAEEKFNFFNLHECLKRVLSTQLCQSAALQNKACSSRIQLNDIHLQEYLYNLLKLTSTDISNAPQLFISSRGKDFIKRERGFDFILKRAIGIALIDFIELFLHRVAQGEIESPFVDIPQQAVQGEEDEAVNYKEVGENDEDNVNAFSRLEEKDPDEEENADPFAQPKEEENEEEDGEENNGGGESLHEERDDDEDNDRPWKLDEGPRGRYNEDDDLPDDERRNPRQLSFNEEVEVQEFKKDAPVSVLKRNNPSRIYKTKFNPDA